MFAAIILAILLISISFIYKEPSLDNKLLYAYAKNTLLHMDKSLKTKDQLAMNEEIIKCIPINYMNYQLNVKYYDYNNELVDSITFGGVLPPDYVVLRRHFNHTNGFGIANLRVWLGKSIIELIPIILDLWEVYDDKPLPVDFTSGLNSTGNSFGPYGLNDGWDWDKDFYGTGTSTCVFWNNATVAVDQELIIRIGDVDNTCIDSGAGDGQYGIKFYINNTVAGSSSINISFDWVFDDNGLDWTDDAWVKARFGDTTQMHYLGTNAGYASDDPTPDIHYDFDPNDASGSFVQDVSSIVDSEGWYYLDVGCKVKDWDNNEWLECGFDNINIEWG